MARCPLHDIAIRENSCIECAAVAEYDIIEKHKKERLEASQDFKNGLIDLVTYGQILNNITYTEEKQGIKY